MDTEFDIEVKDAFLIICAGDEKEAREAFAWLYHETWEEVLGVLKSRSDIIAVDITLIGICFSGALVELQISFFTQINRSGSTIVVPCGLPIGSATGTAIAAPLHFLKELI